nr:hypothetical protein [Tanacetum cinerariifolium]
MDEGTKILATVDGKLRTIFESSIRRNLKLKDKAGISSLPDVELFENLTLMGLNFFSIGISFPQQGEPFFTSSGKVFWQWELITGKTAFLTRSSSQPQSSYEAAATLSEFELTKILIDKMKKNKSFDVADYKRDLYDSAHTEEPSHTVEDSSKQQDQEFITGDNDEQPTNKEVTKADSFKKLERPLTPDPDWIEIRLTCLLGHFTMGPKCQRFYGYASNLSLSKDVYSRRRTITVTTLKIMKKYDYGHLEEIDVRRDDQQLYMFKEGDFKRLHLQDIEDMLLLLVQQRLTNLTIDEQYDLNVALRMYTRCIFIQRWVNKTAYTSYSDPHGIIYVDQNRRKRFMRTDEPHKFSDGTLNDVRSALHDIVARIRTEYMPMRK